MGLYALAHQRHMLECMGIEVWIPRDTADIQTVESSLYRDVAVADLPIATPIHFASSLTGGVPSSSQAATAISVEFDRTQSIEQSHPPVTPELSASVLSTTPTTIQEEVVEATVNFAAFEIHAAVFPYCILVLESSQLSAEQHKLWLNIQAAQASQTHVLKWPFAIEQFQDGRGVMAYVQGFLAAIQQEQRIIVLGKLPIQFDTAVVHLPSLQDMLDQPLLKRQLWQHMLSHI